MKNGPRAQDKDAEAAPDYVESTSTIWRQDKTSPFLWKRAVDLENCHDVRISDVKSQLLVCGVMWNISWSGLRSSRF